MPSSGPILLASNKSIVRCIYEHIYVCTKSKRFLSPDKKQDLLLTREKACQYPVDYQSNAYYFSIYIDQMYN